MQERQVEDVTFIFTEMERLSSLPFSAVPRADKLAYSLPHPNGIGKMLIGQMAQKRLTKLASAAGEQAGINRRVEPIRLRRAFGQELVRRFLIDERPLISKEVDRAMASATRAVRAEMADIRHLIPCHLMRASDPDEIIIGPVRFMNRKKMRQHLLDLLRQRVESEIPHKDTSFVRKNLAEAIRYYRNFNWMAEVEIKACDSKTSAALAQRAVTAALDGLHLILGARSTDRMQIGGPPINYDRRHSLQIRRDDYLESGFSGGGFGQVGFREGWSTRLENSDYQYFLKLFGIALEAEIDPDLERPLSRRVLDAAQWFGEATRDVNASTRVVKYVTALERILMTEERDDISSTISTRLAAFCYKTENDHVEWVKRTQAVYNLRSRLVHGSISPSSPEVRLGVGEAAKVSEAGILNILAALGDRGLREKAVSTRRIARWFNNAVENAPRFAEQRHGEKPQI
ncbi:HEPN domain-containing protein [Brevundimonas sp.]|uniref:HEPN domain-containing protein n=1 Tax=Brevundimonas sp. TaxID=1871086 RepID=UPI002899CCAC|nr:HEPN domain-containing protein [Brevundimonas sp.]